MAVRVDETTAPTVVRELCRWRIIIIIKGIYKAQDRLRASITADAQMQSAHQSKLQFTCHISNYLKNSQNLL